MVHAGIGTILTFELRDKMERILFSSLIVISSACPTQAMLVTDISRLTQFKIPIFGIASEE